ncbi:MAG: hypothetical protein R3Y35_11460 [Clostridia bacterium]
MKNSNERNVNEQLRKASETLKPVDKHETIRIVDENGVAKEIEVLHYFTLKSNGRDYIVYTDYSKDEHGNILVCTSELIEQEDQIEFTGIESEDIILQITELLEELAREKLFVFECE